jgi:hypothetical protein
LRANIEGFSIKTHSIFIFPKRKIFAGDFVTPSRIGPQARGFSGDQLRMICFPPKRICQTPVFSEFLMSEWDDPELFGRNPFGVLFIPKETVD